MNKQIDVRNVAQIDENIAKKSDGKVKKAAKNSLGLITSQFLSKLLSFVAFIYLARYLSESESKNVCLIIKL